MKTTYMAFRGTDELRTLSSKMDDAEAVPLFYNAPSGALEEVPATVGIFNKTQQYLIGTASDKYSILQNAAVLTELADSFDQADVTPVGQICNDYHRMGVEVHFPELAIDELHSNKPIYMGAKFMNSYDKSSTFKGFGFMYRMICSNGAYAQQSLGDMKFSIVHYGDLHLQAPEVIQLYIQRLDGVSEKMGKILEVAQSKTVMFDDKATVIRSLGAWVDNKRAGKDIFQHLLKEVPEDEMSDISRYDLWNAYTSYVSHQDKLSESVRDKISRLAEDLLNPRISLSPIEEQLSKEVRVQVIA